MKMAINHRSWGRVGCAFVVALACGCSATVDDAASESDDALYSGGGTEYWPGGTVPVCFENGLATDGTGDPNPASAHPQFPTLSRLIQSAVNDTWGRVANVRFVGFGTCPSNDPWANPATVAIHWEPTNANSGIGRSGAFWTRMRLNPADLAESEWYFRGVVAHEFGHALGFAHEFDRPDNPLAMGEDCWGGAGSSGAYYGTPFDPYSIMTFTYCRTGKRPDAHPGVLSAWDIVGVQRQYGRKHPGAVVGVDNRCLDIPIPSGGPGTRLQAFTCNGGDNQRFRRDASSRLFAPGGWFSSITTDSYVDVPGGVAASGTGLQIWTRNDPVTENQRWSFDDVQIKGIGDKCLEVADFDFRAGARVQLWSCHGLVNQRWAVSPDGEIRSRGGDGGWCLDVPWGSATSGNPLQLHRCHGGPSQRFETNDLGELKFDGLCLDVRGGGVSDGAIVQLYGCGGGVLNQQWHLTGPIHGAGGNCLDIRGGAGSGNRAAAQIYTCHGGANQEWDYYFER